MKYRIGYTGYTYIGVNQSVLGYTVHIPMRCITEGKYNHEYIMRHIIPDILSGIHRIYNQVYNSECKRYILHITVHI